jgi:lantibiotic transport system ATP-binding protein
MHVFSTESLSRRFGEVRAVEDINLEVPPGSVFGFLGPNGAGKTTTIRLLLGLLRPHRGAVRLFGEPLERRRRTLLAQVGSLVETPSLYPHLTGRENIDIRRLLLGLSAVETSRVLDVVRLQDAAGRLVGGYSLGMRQRLGLALALLGRPRLLILDEPTNGLDPAGIKEIRELIRQLAAEEGITVFLSSHLLPEVEQVASHIGVISRGRMVFQGDPESFRPRRRARLVVGTGDPARAAVILESHGWTAELLPDGKLALDAAAIEPARLNQILVSHDVAVWHLALEQPTLEQTFLEMTETPQ